MIDDNRNILICDLYNMFIRAWAVFPAMSVITGEQMGGVVGSLKMLASLCNQFQPKAVYIVWEGGGSTRRRAIFPEYKMGRRPERLNRYYEDDIPESDDNRKQQLFILFNAMKHIPVYHTYVSDCEADDVIAYLCKGTFKNHNKIITSSDKDMYQLLDDNTMCYSFHKKTLIAKQTVYELFNVSADNFALAKALCGDPSDNIPGVKGVGYKTLVKNVPLFATKNDLILDELFDYCSAHSDESKTCKKIIDNKKLIERNWKLIYLDVSTLSNDQAQKINHQVSSQSVANNNVIEFTKVISKAGVKDFDVMGFFSAFNCIER